MTGHDHAHGISAQTATGSYRWRLTIVLGIYACIIVAQVVGALLTNSIALVAEALHMTVDASGIFIALIATYFATRAANSQRTYGLMRAEIVAVLINCLLLFGLGGYILYAAITRFVHPPEVAGSGVIVFAFIGLIGAVISLVLLSRGAKESLNVRAAFLEVMSDGIGAAAIIISGILNVTLGWNQGDAIAAAAIGVIILPRAFVLLKKALNIILQGVPEGISIKDVEHAIVETDAVHDVHSLHVWALTSGVPVLSAHVVLESAADVRTHGSRVLDELTRKMREQFHIEHVTFQLEEPAHLSHEGAMHRQLAGQHVNRGALPTANGRHPGNTAKPSAGDLQRPQQT